MGNAYYVYILSNKNGMLYVGVTNDLDRRIHEHKAKLVPGYTKKFGIDRLIFFEAFDNINEAREAEKRIKGWRRAKKLDLIREHNPRFADLSEEGRTD